MNFYTYIYTDPRKPGNYSVGGIKVDYEPFYVGKGKDARWKDHLLDSSLRKNTHKNNKIQKLLILEYDLKKYVVIVPSCSEKEAFNLEEKLISFYGRLNNKTGFLTNLTDGGEGVSGIIRTENECVKISERNKKYFNQPHIIKEISKRALNAWNDPIQGKKWKESISNSKKHKEAALKNGINICNKRWNKENRQETLNILHNTHNKIYLIIYPDGHKEEVNRMPQYCKENNLSYGALLRTANGLQKHWQNHECVIIKETYRDGVL
jgi:hypothetical protein